MGEPRHDWVRLKGYTATEVICKAATWMAYHQGAMDVGNIALDSVSYCYDTETYHYVTIAFETSLPKTYSWEVGNQQPTEEDDTRR